jgi:DNA-directed RNA polymerase subunit RPC12/RpoP
LHVEKESGKENLHGQQKEGGITNIVNIGDHNKCPECNRIGRIFWISQDGKTAGIQCPASHRLMSRPVSKFGSTARPPSKTDKNMVFLMEIK